MEAASEALCSVATCYTENAADKDEQDSNGLFAQSLLAMQKKEPGNGQMANAYHQTMTVLTCQLNISNCLPLFTLDTLVHYVQPYQRINKTPD